MRKTDDDSKQAFYRSPHLFVCHEGEWYFQTREGVRGPFRTRQAAELNLARYIDTMEFVDDHKPSLPSDIDWSDVTIVEVEEPRF